MTTPDKISHERIQIHYKLELLHAIDLADQALELLKTNHKDTESKEIEIHFLWKKYEEL